jgi:hypothetical protein
MNSHDDALKHLDLQIEKARLAANAEAAFDAANGREGPNPWANAKKALDDLEDDRRQLVLKHEGEKLNEAIRELRRLDQELEKAQAQREAADRALRERKEHETVQRYLGATSTCMKLGWGHSWTAFFRPWYESGKPRYMGANEQAVFFLDSPLAQDAGVQFDLDGEREAVRRYVEAFDAANQAAITWSAHASHRADLLREHPELKAAS